MVVHVDTALAVSGDGASYRAGAGPTNAVLEYAENSKTVFAVWKYWNCCRGMGTTKDCSTSWRRAWQSKKAKLKERIARWREQAESDSRRRAAAQARDGSAAACGLRFCTLSYAETMISLAAISIVLDRSDRAIDGRIDRGDVGFAKPSGNARGLCCCDVRGQVAIVAPNKPCWHAKHIKSFATLCGFPALKYRSCSRFVSAKRGGNATRDGITVARGCGRWTHALLAKSVQFRTSAA